MNDKQAARDTAKQPTWQGFRAYYYLLMGEEMDAKHVGMWKEHYLRVGYHPMVK